MYSLYNSVICPFSKQIRIILSEKQIPFHLIDEDYWNYDLAFAKINPAMDLPVLIEPDGKSIIGIYAVIEYLFELNQKDELFTTDTYQKAEIRRLVSWFNDKFYREVSKLIIDERVIKYYLAQGEPDSEILRIAKHNMNSHVKYIDYLLTRRKWLVGEHLTIIDLIAAAHFSILDYLGNINWSSVSSIFKDWYCLVKSRPAFRNILSDRIIGFNANKNYANLDF